MKWMRVSRIGGCTLFTLACASSTCAQDQELYQRSRRAYANGEVEALRTIAQEYRQRGDGYFAALVEAGASFKADDVRTCRAVLDSIIPLLPAEEKRSIAFARRIDAAVYKWAGRSKEGMQSVAVGLAELEGPGLAGERADLLVLRAELQRNNGELDGAMASLVEAQRAADEGNNVLASCNVLINRGNILYKQDRMEEARAAYTATLACAHENGFPALVNAALNNLGSIAVMTGRYDVAMSTYDSVLVSLGSSNIELRSRLHNQKGVVYTRTGRLAQAITEFRTALLLKDSVGDRVGRAKVQEHWSSALWASGQRSEAIALLNEAASSAFVMGSRVLEAEIRHTLYEWYLSTGDTRRALEEYKRYTTIDDSLALAKYDDRLATAEMMFETERKNKMIRQGERDLAQATASADRKRWERNALLGLSAMLTLVVLLFWQGMRSRNRLATKARELHEQRVNELIQGQEIKTMSAMMEGQHAERERVAKELHDRVGSMLSSVKHQFSALELRVTELKDEQRGQYKKVYGLLDEVVGEVRRISHDMVAGTLARFGLPKALTDLKDAVQIKGRIEVELSIFGVGRLERSLEIALYRVIQELVSNVLKHAQASELTIALTQHADRLNVIVADNGKGFDVDQLSDGMGMVNVRSRIAAFNGELTVDSSLGRGTTVSIQVPLT